MKTPRRQPIADRRTPHLAFVGDPETQRPLQPASLLGPVVIKTTRTLKLSPTP